MTSRNAALAHMRGGYAEMEAVLAGLEADDLEQPGVVGEWSLRDVLAHFAGYERYVAAEVIAALEDREATNNELYGGEEAPTAEDDLNDDTSNAWVVGHARLQPLQAVLDEFSGSHHHLVEAVERCSDPDFEDPTRFAFCNGRSLASVMPNQCWAHYEQHLPDIRRWRADRQER